VWFAAVVTFGCFGFAFGCLRVSFARGARGKAGQPGPGQSLTLQFATRQSR
jgi:hypothetical protein